jgi:hypothetical protein
MSVDTDNFIMATFALWAGDFEYAETLLSRYANVPPLNGAVESPDDLIRRTSALRLRQLRQKKGEFKLLAAEHGLRNPVLPNPTVLVTNHLRGALWRLGAREFDLRAYLTDLTWEENLLRLAHIEADQHERSLEPVEQTDSSLGFGDNEPSRMTRGVTWTVTGSFLLRAQLSDMCLLEVNGLWTEAKLTNSDEEIKEPFLKLLHALDPDSVRSMSGSIKQTG